MKTFISSLFILSISMSSFATTLSEIHERGTARSIVFDQERDSLVITLKDGNLTEVLNTLDLSQTDRSLNISGKEGSTYSFEILKKGFQTTGNIYDWCYGFKARGLKISGILAGAGVGVGIMAASGALLPVAGTAVVVGVGSAVAVCGVGPALPAAAGIALLPIDLMITLGAEAADALDSENIAAKKFKKAMEGKNKKASKKVFKQLIDKIQEL